MHTDEMQRRARSFEQGAAAYERLRPGYPDELFALIGERAGDRFTRGCLEVGPGTGRATLPLTRMASRVVAVEPSADMIAVLSDRLADAGVADRVEIRQATFEGVDRAESYGVVAAAQSFHWADPDTRWERLADLIRDDGRAYLFWNGWHLDPARHDLAAVAALYRDYAPGLRPDLPERSTDTGWAEAEIDAHPRLRLTLERRIHWSRDLANDDYLALLATTSQYATADPETRERLFDALRPAVGETVSLAGRTLLLEVAAA